MTPYQHEINALEIMERFNDIVQTPNTVATKPPQDTEPKSEVGDANDGKSDFDAAITPMSPGPESFEI